MQSTDCRLSLCPAVLEKGIIAAGKKKIWPHCRNNHRSSDLPPPPSVLSLSLSVSPSLSFWLSVRGPSWFRLHPSIHKSFPSFYWLHGTWQVLIFSVASLLENTWFLWDRKRKRIKKKKKWQTKQNKAKSSPEFSLDKKLSGRFVPS